MLFLDTMEFIFATKIEQHKLAALHQQNEFRVCISPTSFVRLLRKGHGRYFYFENHVYWGCILQNDIANA